MDEEQKLSIINDARTASITLQWMKPLFERKERDIIASLKSCFRQGKQTELVLSCHVSQLCVLEDLEEELNGIRRRGESVNAEGPDAD